MQPRKAQKRSATSVGEPSTPHLPNPKKTRFVDPSDDPLNFAEEVDSALEDPSAKRKGRIRNEGYESDSSDDGEGVVFSRRKDESGDAGAEEDDDMFTMGEKEAKKDTESTGTQKKKEEFLRLGDIEGQEFNESEHESESEDEEPEDEDDVKRRKQAGMGYELSSFNMREEMEEGKFAADGTYVKTFDPHAVHDRWMDGFDDEEIQLARRRKRQRDRVEREKMKAEERELEQSGGKSALEMQLIAKLKRGETVLEALQRLGVNEKKKHATNRSKDKSNTVVDKPPPQGVSDIALVTHLASNIMSLGDNDIYSKTYEELVRDIRSSGQVQDDWVPPSADMKYEYRWKVFGQSSEPSAPYGPFSEQEMSTWFRAHYFGEFGEKIQVRAIGGEWGDWDDVHQL